MGIYARRHCQTRLRQLSLAPIFTARDDVTNRAGHLSEAVPAPILFFNNTREQRPENNLYYFRRFRIGV